MNQYEQFCRLRDFRAPGTEVPKHTEAEAFALALALAPAAAPINIAPPAAASPKCWSADEENYNYGTLGELLDSNGHLCAGDVVSTGYATAPGAAELCGADDVIEIMRDRAHDIAGEFADDYPEVTPEAELELDALLAGWINKHCAPTFYTVSGVTPYILISDDIASAQKDDATPATTN